MAQTMAAPQAPAPTQPAYPQHPYGQAPQAQAPQAQPPQAQPPQQPQQAYAPQPQQGYPQPQQGHPHPQPAQPYAQGYPQQASAAQPAGGYARDPFAPVSPSGVPHSAASIPAQAMIGDKLHITADLGAQSPTNFYKGLSGNDIVDHGGLFVSTYMIPKIGTSIRLKVSLPGGYEFEADANVRWARDVRDASSDAPPGFGAQFTNITPEARQLIYRYVRNREPLFHDDL
jgi:hypothetical protein